jgi:hypothetical protein
MSLPGKLLTPEQRRRSDQTARRGRGTFADTAIYGRFGECRRTRLLGRSTMMGICRRFRCTMRVDCGQLDAGAVIRPEPGEWHPRMPERVDEEELADWRAGRNAVYQLAALRSARASRLPTDKSKLSIRTSVSPIRSYKTLM